MKKLLLSLASLTMLTSQIHAQYFEFDSLNINNLSILIESNGDMHRDTSSTVSSHMPAGSNTSTMSRQSLWMEDTTKIPNYD